MDEKTHGPQAGDPCALFPFQVGRPEKEKGMLMLFLTADQLRRGGTLAVRMWIEKNIPLRPPRLRPGRVVEFDRTGHKAAPTLGES